MTIYDDLLITAIEGGINYWAEVSDYHHGANDETSATVYEDDADTDGVTVTTTDIRRAVRQVATKGIPAADPGSDLGDRFKAGCNAALRGRGGDWDFDATAADALIQVAMFGDVVYG